MIELGIETEEIMEAEGIEMIVEHPDMTPGGTTMNDHRAERKIFLRVVWIETEAV